MRLQCLHNGELGVVLEAGWLVPQDLLQDSQGQGPNGVLGDSDSQVKITFLYLHKEDEIWCVTSCPHIFVPQRLEQQQQHGLEMLLPHHQAVLSRHLQQLQQRPPPLFWPPLPCVAVGELLQQRPNQLQLFCGAC